MRSGANWVKDDDGKRRRLKKRFALATQIFLQWPRVNIDAKTNMGVVPLYFAADSGSVEVARLLLQYGACVTIEVEDETVKDFIRFARHASLLQYF